jgi:predicted nucleotidyltransferase
MSKDWDITFGYWGSCPSDTEQDKCGNAERAIRKAIAASPTLREKPIDVFVQGSYANGTNVRQDSDVDVCVLYKGNAFFTDYQLAPNLNDAALSLITADYNYRVFKIEIEAALVAYFGRQSVRRGNKAFDIRENTYRIDADVVPCFEHRLYSGDRFNYSYRSGTQLFPDNGPKIVNWPKQNHDNGAVKDLLTGSKFKALTRILKNLRFKMMDEGDKLAEAIPSYLIECLLWNVPVERFANVLYTQNFHQVLAYLWGQTRTDESCNGWTEVNDVKFLFRAGQPWERQQVNDFLLTAWSYVGIA